MITIDKLKEYGADTEKGLSLCMGNEALYLRLVSTIPDEQKFTELKSSIESNDLDTAFENAHALKGVTGNLALSPLYNPLLEITEFLRAREERDYTELITEIITQKDKLSDICK